MGVSVAFLAARSIFGDWDPGYHLLGLLLYGFAGCSVFALARRLTGDNRAAFLAGALFVLHPRLRELAAVPSAACWPLLTIFAAGAILSFLRFLEGERRRDLVISCIAALAATYVREIAFLMPALLLAAAVALVDPERRRGRLVRSLLPHILIAATVVIHLVWAVAGWCLVAAVVFAALDRAPAARVWLAAVLLLVFHSAAA